MRRGILALSSPPANHTPSATKADLLRLPGMRRSAGRKRGVGLVAFVGVGLGWTAGCAAILDIQELPDAAVVADAEEEVDAGHAAPPDGSLAPGADAAVDSASDSAVDTGDAAPVDGAAPPTFCALNPGHTICVDFDEPGNALTYAFYEGNTSTLATEVINDGTLKLDVDGGLSLPGALSSALLGEDEAGTGTAGALTYAVPPDALVVQVQFDVLVNASTPWPDQVRVVTLNQVFPNQAWAFTSLALSSANSSGNLLLSNFPRDQYGTTLQPDLQANIPIGDGWQRFLVNINRDPDGGSVAILFGSPATAFRQAAQTVSVGASFLLLELGLAANGATPPVSARYDNIVVDVVF